MGGEERVALLGSSAPSHYSHLSETLSPPPEDRRQNTKLRSNSVCVFSQAEEEVVFTSYGPVVLQEADSPRLSRSPLVGWLLAVLSGLLFTGNNFLVKYYSIGATDMLLVRSTLQTLLMAVIIGNDTTRLRQILKYCFPVLTKRPFLPSKKLDGVLVVSQGVLGGLRTLFQFACVLYLPLGDALTIVFTEPLWTLLLSRIFLGIKISFWKIFFGCLLICGMVLCIQPPVLFPSPCHEEDRSSNSSDGHSLNENYYLGVLLALGTALTGSLANVSIAKCDRVSSKVMVFYSGLGGVFIALICIVFDQESKVEFNILLTEAATWPLLLLLGLMGILGYFSLTRSLRLIPPTTVAVLRAMEIILAYVVQVICRLIVIETSTRLDRQDQKSRGIGWERFKADQQN